MTHRMIQGASKKHPGLRGKAAQIRSLIPVLIKVWSDKFKNIIITKTEQHNHTNNKNRKKNDRIT